MGEPADAAHPPAVEGQGIILRLDRVLPDEPADFAPNAAMQIRPEFLEQVILRLRELGLDIVDLDEAARRGRERRPDQALRRPDLRRRLAR